MKKIVKIFLIFLFPLVLLACSSALPPKSFVRTPYFNVITPDFEGWHLEAENVDSIILRRGRIGVNLTPSDLPVQRIAILRKTVRNTVINELQLKYELKKEAYNYAEEMVKSTTPIGQFGYSHYFDSSHYDINNFHTIIYSISDLITHGKTLVQVYFYIPKYYNEWKIYYLILYAEYPYYLSDEHKQAITYRKPFDLELNLVLSKVLEGFKCIEDSLQEKQRPAKKSE